MCIFPFLIYFYQIFQNFKLGFENEKKCITKLGGDKYKKFQNHKTKN